MREFVSSALNCRIRLLHCLPRALQELIQERYPIVIIVRGNFVDQNNSLHCKAYRQWWANASLESGCFRER